MKITIELTPGNKWTMTHELEADRPVTTANPDAAAYLVLQWMGIHAEFAAKPKRHILAGDW